MSEPFEGRKVVVVGGSGGMGWLRPTRWLPRVVRP